MNKQLALAILILTAFMAASAHAARKKGATGATAAKAGMPSARLEPLLEPCLDAILSPLEKDPRMPRVDVEKLRSNFAGGQIKAKTPAEKEIYQNAMVVCEALTKAMDDRAKAKSNALASAKVPSISDGSGIVKSSPVRGSDAGANAEAIRKKQFDERRYADKQARARSAFVETTAYKAWTDKSAYLRQSIMARYTRQIQLEALEEQSAAAAATAQAAAAAQAAKVALSEKKPAPVVAKVTPKERPAKGAVYAGTWTTLKGAGTYLIKDDHTAIKMRGGDDKVNGTWTVETDGDFHVKWQDRTHFKAKLAEDGQTLNATAGSNMRWTRKKP